MNEETAQQIFDELLSSLEPLDTRNAALLQFLKAKGLVTDEDLAPYLEQAGNASNVRWLAARIRIRSLISSAMKPTEQPVETESAKPSPTSSEAAAETSKESAETTKGEAEVQKDNSNPEKPVLAVGERGQNKKESGNTDSKADTKKTEADEDARQNVA